MNLKKTVTMATLATMIGIPALGITNNAHAASNNIHQKVQYMPEGPHGEYEPVFNNGKGPVDDIGDKSMPKNLTKSQADELNSGQTVNGFNEYNNKLYSNKNSQIKSTQANNNQTQYTNKKSLPQTGEINNKAKSLVASIIFGAMSVGFGALSMKKQNQYHSTIHVDNAIDNGSNTTLNNILNDLRHENNELDKLIK